MPIYNKLLADIVRNVTIGEFGLYGISATPARQFRIIFNFSRVAFSLFSIIPTYSEDTLIAALAAYRNGEYTSTRKCAYAFNIPRSTLLDRLTNRTSYSKSYES